MEPSQSHPKTQRQSGISRRIVEYLREHPDKQFSPESISLNSNLPVNSVKSAMSKLVKGGQVEMGDVRGLYKATESNHRLGGPNPGDVLEIIRVRANGDIILMDEGGLFWVAQQVPI